MIYRVMVFTPYGPRLEPETVNAVLTLTWPGPLVQVFQRELMTGDSYQDILHQYRVGREAFLAGDFDAMLVIESDVIPPPDTLEKLAALDCDLAYGVYVFRPAVRQRRVINVYYPYKPRGRNPGESFSLRPELLRQALQTGTVECSGAGLGCVLIKRHVLEAVDFRQKDGGHCDTWFTNDVYRAGYEMRADMSVVCGHKDTDGTVLYPKEMELFSRAFAGV